ncbi:hypothetical protein [Streptomyces noursei]|uniref:hypothetical protein n=1 Tax=Streptomyces noursei TaxID=1971 RepID=UPI001672AF03|nr:hypothetical protein [Streptomyces noursei]MCZ1012811.1 hypothetical protein [Streptomyces noursei]GGX20210.1 hypothetical protein GCM10010341_46850 [Streptomyces noursei]
MRTMFRRAATIVAGTAAAAVLTIGTAGAAPASTWAGCPDGAVCVYPQGQDPAATPSLTFWSYGAHNLSGQVGYHWVLNNQYGGAHAQLCTGYNGTGDCYHDMAPQNGWWTDLTPVNSIVLYQ